MKVILYPADVALATTAGEARFARREGAEHRWNRSEDQHTVELEIEAIGAEIAVARAIGRDWADSVHPDHDGDVGEGIQVRHTRYESGRLLLHYTDRDDHWYFLVTGTFPVFRVVGFIRGDAAKKVGMLLELQEGRPALAVEQKDLLSMKAESIYTKAAA